MLRKILNISTCIAICAGLIIPTITHGATSGLDVTQEIGANNTPPATGSSGSKSDVTSPQISNVKLTVTNNTATIEWQNDEISLANVRWGVNQDYTGGIISLTQYSRSQLAYITGLKENTEYYFLITVSDQNGNQSSYSGRFITVSAPDVMSPANVSRFNALPYQESIGISWLNPPDLDFDFVRIVRSTSFYPLDPFNGTVVYEGRGQMVTDENVQPGEIYYYSAFSRDTAGNYSSGAVTSAMIAWYSETLLPPGPVLEPVVDLEPIPAEEIPEILLTRDDFTFFYIDKSLKEIVINGRVLILPLWAELQVSILESSLYDEATNLTISVEDPTRKLAEASYLFSFDKETRKHTVKLPLFENAGEYKLKIIVFNSDKKVMQELILPFRVIEGDSKEPIEPGSIANPNMDPQSRNMIFWVLGLIVSLSLLLILVWRFTRRTRVV